ncbi:MULTISPECIES: hypothetical protein [Streptomycetaceae]|uniref:Gliding motility protein n=1 Tax=Streptantibioticus cattleyicolor (strain ATCC 35852 / DSM 46488 / JCM 4925 / NBRC 14057 / NRRL 8057) TaxID=1003195 RepID=F8JUT6_STREN|nr:MULTISPECIES: hypothetical protein [Streptomycetaceae]AEW96920.1 hypothetical protein SCATT_45490 [Streptantibioticus cattleyicolor NRRL 8057 = DSM 46488]MYS61397.1 hypothetical protein [Streptomyces sp. SID5468]CCB77249.1 conserved exported protein of unknown function [Streptantibioticus cattleyicolor NRRL 8057 = DSM 46488]
MGVLEWFRRRSAAGAAVATEAPAQPGPAATPAGDSEPATRPADGRTDAADEAVGIPKQQSAGEAADSETGKGAHT